MESNYIYHAPVKPVAPWLGGKSRLAERLIDRIDGIDHQIYVEPFVGMGGVFLRRTKIPTAEVINDYSRDVANFFRVLKVHYVALMEWMKWDLTIQAEFERLSKEDPETLTDIQRAARFIYLQRCAFGGKPSGQSFGISQDRPARLDVTKLGPLLEDLHARLASVTIVNKSYVDLIPLYDRPETLFYLDPPYFGGENDYGKGLFSRDDFLTIATLMRELQGKFILSINDVPDIREIFDGFHMEEVRTTYSIAKESCQDVGELIISNVKLEGKQPNLF